MDPGRRTKDGPSTLEPSTKNRRYTEQENGLIVNPSRSPTIVNPGVLRRRRVAKRRTRLWLSRRRSRVDHGRLRSGRGWWKRPAQLERPQEVAARRQQDVVPARQHRDILLAVCLERRH